MMNNPWYRLTISKEGDYLRFEHPTQPALIPGGWMEKVKAKGGNLANGFWGEKMGDEEEEGIIEVKTEVKMTKDGLDKHITIDDLRKHDGDMNPWFVVNGEVYDGTAFLEGHPGGATSIIGAAGQDATDEFMAIRSFPPRLPRHSLTESRFRNSQSNDANLPHRLPRRSLPRRAQRPRTNHALILRSPAHLPPVQILDQSHPLNQKKRLS
jgi:cytochrome b involved in lipid metabolism